MHLRSRPRRQNFHTLNCALVGLIPQVYYCPAKSMIPNGEGEGGIPQNQARVISLENKKITR
jgi:hypothetical protein